jgi:hypothetical protein
MQKAPFSRSSLHAVAISLCLPVALTGCARDLVTGAIRNDDFISSEQVASIDDQADRALTYNMTRPERDTYLTEKMFVIDRNYAFYERNIARDDNFVKFFGSLATIGMSTAATVIPLGSTTKILTATVTAVQGTEKAIDQDLLLSLAVQSIQKQMRADRANQAKLIWNRISACTAAHYPIYIAMSDLETYRRAGTFESAVEGLAKTTSAVETAAVNNKNSASAATAQAQPAAAAAAAATVNKSLTAAVGISPPIATNSPTPSVCPI